MTKRPNDAQMLYKAVKKSPAREQLKMMPAELREKFRLQLEGLQIPVEGKAKQRFVSAFAAFVEKQHPALFIYDEERLERAFKRIQMLTGLSGKSANPVEFMRVLAIAERAEKFAETMGFLEKREEFTLLPVSEEAMQEASRITDLLKDGSDEALSALAVILKQRLETFTLSDEYNAIAYLTGDVDQAKRIFSANHPEHAEWFGRSSQELLYDGEHTIKTLDAPGLLYHDGRLVRIASRLDVGMFCLQQVADPRDIPDKYGFATQYSKTDNPTIPVVLGAGSGATLQHEIQHGFDFLVFGEERFLTENKEDRERRAYLASWAFMRDGEEFGEALDRILEAQAETLLSGADNRRKPSAHSRALMAVDCMISEYIEEPLEVIKAKARELLNEEYRKLTGLTYDEILEPFRR